MKTTLALAALLALTGSLAQAQSKTGRESGYRYRSTSKQATPAAPAPAKKSVAPAAKPKAPAPQARRRRDEGPSEQGPTPVPGALIRTAGVGTKTESHNPGWTHFGDSNQGGGYAISGGNGLALSGKGVRHGRPDNQTGRGSASGASSQPFGTGGGYQSWLSGINNTTINGNAHNNNQNNGGGNGNGNGN